MKSLLVACCVCLLAAAGCRSCESERPRARPPAAPVQDRPAVLGETFAHRAPSPLPPGVLGAHLLLRDNVEYTFGERGGGVLWTYPTDDMRFQVFHNGRPGPAFDQIGQVALSPDGLHWAYAGLTGDGTRLVVDGQEKARYETIDYTTISPDGAHLSFQARIDGALRLVVDGIPRRSAPHDYLAQSFSADSSRLVFHEPVDEQTARIVVADLAFENPVVAVARATMMQVSEDRTRVAAVEPVEGGMRVVSFDVAAPGKVRRGKTYLKVGGLSVGPGGAPVAYYAGLGSGERLFVVEDDELRLAGDEEIVSGAAPRPGLRGFGALVKANGAVTFRELFMEPGATEPPYVEAAGLTYGGDGRHHAYVAGRAGAWFVVANGKEGPPFEAVRPPAFSPDGKYLVYRARRGATRFVVVADPDGKTLRELPPHEQVYDVRFTADGRSVAYGVKDGRRLAWEVEPLP